MSELIYQRLGVHVWAPDRDVLRELETRLKPEFVRAHDARARRHELFRSVLASHHDHQDLCREFRL